ncbi:hypothetical protein O3M35_009722 [Rhynocoris fuscipes]|uniref:Complex I assembly factor TIMMDC1, mitochondrial n=1 Tax=Rhynocoris fuscipes TaxID=488301 RepID=A0AAW1DAZ5_9HEMI
MIFLRPVLRTGGLFCAAILTPKPESTIQTQPSKSVDEKKLKGWDKIYEVFTVDEYGSISPELSTIYQTTFFTAFVGACYGGFMQSRQAYLQFIERNQATSFVDHYEAKKKLQDHVTVNFAKGALRLSWRLALFSGLYVTFVTLASAYRGEPKLIDYVAGGLVSGGLYQVNMGLRGVIVGGTLGTMIGLLAGSLTLAILKFTGASLDEVHQFRYDLYNSRGRHLDEAVSKREMEKLNEALRKRDTAVQEKDV